MQNKLNKTNIVIINGALRLTNNPLLIGLNGPTIFVFVLTPYYFSKAHYTDIPTVGENRFKYLFRCINRFREELKNKFNCDLLVLEGTYKQVIDSISDYFTNVDVRVLHQPYPYEITYEEELLNSNYNKLNNTVTIIKDGNTLLPFNTAVELYKSNYSGTFSSFFNSYLKLQKDIQWVDSLTINPINVTVDIKSTECDSNNNNFIYDFDNLVGYANNKNYISGKSTIKCEAALSLGTLSKALAWGFTLNNKEASNDDKMAFIRSLIWSDYCYVIAEVEGIKLYTKDGLSKDLNKGKVELIPDWIKGTGTDVKFYNKAMTRLRQDGYLPNRIRMMLGSYIIKVMGYSHLAYSEYLEHFLIGFNCANNWLGAQSCNGTGVDTIPSGRSFNIRKQLDQWDLDGVYK